MGFPMALAAKHSHSNITTAVHLSKDSVMAQVRLSVQGGYIQVVGDCQESLHDFQKTNGVQKNCFSLHKILHVRFKAQFVAQASVSTLTARHFLGLSSKGWPRAMGLLRLAVAIACKEASCKAVCMVGEFASTLMELNQQVSLMLVWARFSVQCYHSYFAYQSNNVARS